MRPTKFTAKTRRALIRAIKDGAPYTMACQAAGITYQTFRTWIKIAEAIEAGETPLNSDGSVRQLTKADEKEFLKFHEDIQAAEGKGMLDLLRFIRKVAKNENDPRSVRAAMWILERRSPEFNPKITQTIQEIDLSTLSDDQLKRLAKGEDPASVLQKDN